MDNKIVFVNPPLTKEERYKNLAEAGNELPPLGLATLAAVTRENGHDTKILDAQALRLSSTEAADWIIDERPKYVGITAVTLSISNAADVARKVKEKDKGITVILGGPHVTAVPAETLKRYGDFDVGVFGEGEETIVELLAALELRKDLRGVRGLILRDGEDVVLTEKRPYIEDLDRLPLPAWDLLPDLRTLYQPPADALHRFPSTLLITSRGCTGQCVFCDRSVFGNTLRGFSAGYMLRMVKHIQAAYGIRDVFFEDDNFLVFRRRLVEFCNGIIDQGLDITWSCMGRVDNVDFELLRLMRKAGCWQINFGCESGSQRILDLLDKKTKVEDVERAIRLTRKAGIGVKGLFMMGNFGEDRQSVRETIDFIRRVPMTDFHITCFTPLPGAKAWEDAPKYGWFDPDWRKVDMFSAANFIPSGFTRQEIEGYYRQAWRAFYLKPRVVLDYLLKMRDGRMRKKIMRSGWGFIKFQVKKTPDG